MEIAAKDNPLLNLFWGYTNGQVVFGTNLSATILFRYQGRVLKMFILPCSMNAKGLTTYMEVL